MLTHHAAHPSHRPSAVCRASRSWFVVTWPRINRSQRISYSSLLSTLLDALRASVERTLFARCSLCCLLKLLLVWWYSSDQIVPLFQTAHFDHPPASIFALKALSSSSSSTTFFLAFLLWIGFVPAVTGAAISTDVPGGRGPSRAAVRASYLRHLKASCRQAGRGDWLIWARQRGETAR